MDWYKKDSNVSTKQSAKQSVSKELSMGKSKKSSKARLNRNKSIKNDQPTERKDDTAEIVNGTEDQEIIALHPEGHYDSGDENKIITADDAENPHILERDYDDDEDVELMLPSSNLPDDAKIIRKRRVNSASSAISSNSVEETRRHSADQKMPENRDEESIIDHQNMSNTNADPNNSIPNIDLSLSVDRRRQSIEGSIIMADAYNINSAHLSMDVNGVASTGDHEYDSGISSLSHAGTRTNQNGLDESTDNEKRVSSHLYQEVDLKKEKQRLINNNYIRPSSAEVLID